MNVSMLTINVYFWWLPITFDLSFLQECYKGPKFGFENDEDTFTLIIKKPETGDTGRYTCTVRECNDLSTKAYLEVERKFSYNKDKRIS